MKLDGRWLLRLVGLFTASSCGLLTACSDDGGGTLTINVELTSSSRADLDPFAPELGLEIVQIVAEGSDRGQDATVSIGPGERTAVISGFPAGGEDGTLTVRAEGLDAQGNLISFGRAPPVSSDSDASVTFPLRRNLAYITHQPNAFQQNPDRFVYVFDVASRSRIEKIQLPGVNPRGEWVTARGGDSLLVTYRDGGIGFLGILSAADHTWRTRALPTAQRVALGVEGQPIVVIAGGGVVTFVDLDNLEAEPEEVRAAGGRLIGGTVRDGVISGDGQTALFILGGVTTGSVIFVDVENRTIEPLDPVRDPAGVALAPDGRVAYVTSGLDQAVAEVDLRTGRVAQSAGFARPVGLAAYSETMQAVLALDADLATRRVLALLPRACETTSELCGQALSVQDATPTTERPVDLAADGVGRQILVVGAGNSTAAAGLTLIETFRGVRRLPVAAAGPYPGDPDDTYIEGQNLVARQRYQPRSVAIIYGR